MSALADEADGVQLMKPNPDLEALLDRDNAKGIFGTKMRSVIKLANPAGIAAVVAQQFDEAKRILEHLVKHYASDPVGTEAARYLEVMRRMSK
mgnify:CR=1 FL=1